MGRVLVLIQVGVVVFVKRKAGHYQPCLSLFSMVIHDAVSILLILPHKLRYDLNVGSSIAPDARMSLSQLSVSAHSFRAISNLECISARLCGYCASVMFAKTLEEDFFIWKTVLESILYSVQRLAILIANSSPYSKSKLRFISIPFRTKSRQSRVWNRSHSERMESATCCGMESSRRESLCTLARDAIRLWRFHAMRKRIDAMPSLRLG